QYPNEEYRFGGSDNTQQLFIASEHDVLINLEGPDAARLSAPVAPSPDARNESSYFTPNAKVEAEQDGNRVTLEAHTADLLSSIDIAKETKFLTLDEIARANEMQNRPWYSRFMASPVTLSIAGEETEHQ